MTLEARTPGTLLIEGGRVVCPASAVDDLVDVLIVDGVVRSVGRALADVPHDVARLDAHGAWVLPGAIDLSTTLRDPGREEEEDLDGTLEAASRGGFTTLLTLPSTCPPVDGFDDVEHRLSRLSRRIGPRVLVAGTLTRGRQGTELAEIAEMAAAGAVAFTDAPSPVVDTELLRRAMETAAAAGGLVLAMGAEAHLSRGGLVLESAVSTRLGLQGIPAAAEVIAVARHIELARLTGARVHVGALSTSRAVQLVEAAQREGLPISGEVHPWHLLLDEHAHLRRPYDTALRLDPPLPAEGCRPVLLDAVRRGVLAVASGHQPVGATGKDVEMAVAEPGAMGLPICLALLVGDGAPGAADARSLDARQLAFAVSTLPARILGLADAGTLAPGARGDVVVIDPTAHDLVDTLVGRRAPTNPFLGVRTRARVRATISLGHVLYRAAELRSERP